MSTSTNKEKARKLLDECVNHIVNQEVDGARLEFISLDVEMTGLTLNRASKITQDLSVQDYFDIHRQGAKTFGILQLGVCLAGRNFNNNNQNNSEYSNKAADDNNFTMNEEEEEEEEEGKDATDNSTWTLKPYNFYVFPQRRRILMTDTHSIRFLIENGFDFNEWVESGLDYESLNDIEVNNRTSQAGKHPRLFGADIEADGVQRVLKAIIENASNVPIVLHNGLLDVLHIIDKFVLSIHNECSNVHAFSNIILSLWPAGVFDTKYMAKQMSQHNLADTGSTSLQSLRESLIYTLENEIPMKVIGDLASKYTSVDAAHEAGFDALITAEALIYEIACLHQASNVCYAIGDNKDQITYFCGECKKQMICTDWMTMLDFQNWNLKNKIERPPQINKSEKQPKKIARTLISKFETEEDNNKLSLKDDKQQNYNIIEPYEDSLLEKWKNEEQKNETELVETNDDNKTTLSDFHKPRRRDGETTFFQEDNSSLLGRGGLYIPQEHYNNKRLSDNKEGGKYAKRLVDVKFERDQEQQLLRQKAEAKDSFKESGKVEETFVTSAYKKKLAQREAFEKELKKREQTEASNVRQGLKQMYSDMLEHETVRRTK